jgi:hypothetical protein
VVIAPPYVRDRDGAGDVDPNLGSQGDRVELAACQGFQSAIGLFGKLEKCRVDWDAVLKDLNAFARRDQRGLFDDLSITHRAETLCREGVAGEKNRRTDKTDYGYQLLWHSLTANASLQLLPEARAEHRGLTCWLFQRRAAVGLGETQRNSNSQTRSHSQSGLSSE